MTMPFEWTKMNNMWPISHQLWAVIDMSDLLLCSFCGQCGLWPLQFVTIRYDTVGLRALKSWRDGQLNLAHGPETKNNEKNINQKPSSSEETVQAKVRGGSPGGKIVNHAYKVTIMNVIQFGHFDTDGHHVLCSKNKAAAEATKAPKREEAEVEVSQWDHRVSTSNVLKLAYKMSNSISSSLRPVSNVRLKNVGTFWNNIELAKPGIVPHMHSQTKYQNTVITMDKRLNCKQY